MGLSRAETQVNAYLEKYRTLRAYPTVPWTNVFMVLGALAVGLIGGGVLYFRRSGPIGKLARWEERIGYAFIAQQALPTLMILPAALRRLDRHAARFVPRALLGEFFRYARPRSRNFRNSHWVHR